MRHKKVGIDLDNTVADYIAGAAPLLKELYGLTPDFTKPAHKIEEVFGLTEETRPDNLREVLYEEKHLFRDLPLLEEDSSLLTSRLYEELVFNCGIRPKIYFLTARTGTPIIVEDTRKWLDHHRFLYDDILFTGRKYLACELLKIDVVMEDEPRQALELIQNKVNVVLMDQPWNREVPESDRLTRVSSWREAVEATKEFLV